jgi:Uma2 family endonuclease
MTVADAVAKKVWTEEELEALPDNGYNFELVDGELVMSPKNNFDHEVLVEALFVPMSMHNRKEKLGAVVGSNLGCWMANRNVRAPDISFISKGRLQALGFTPRTQRFFPEAPDLAVEILSRSNTRREMDERLRDFFASGCRLAWIVNPFEDFAEICRSPIDRRLIGPGGELDGEDVFPGFKFPVDKLFRGNDWD